jgi:hypothetical protein
VVRDSLANRERDMARFMPGSSGARRRIRVNPGQRKHAQAQQRAHNMGSGFGPQSAFDREKDLRMSTRFPVRDASGRLNTGEGAYRYLRRGGIPAGVSYNLPMRPSDYGATTPGAADDRWMGAPIYQDPRVFTASSDQALLNMMNMAALPFQKRGGGLPQNILDALFAGGGNNPQAMANVRQRMQEANRQGVANLNDMGQMEVDPDAGLDPNEQRGLPPRLAARNQGLPYGSGYGPGTYGGSYII